MNALEDYKLSANIFDLLSADLGEGKRSGRWMMFRCPFHGDDKHPSLGARLSDGNTPSGWKCFTCGEAGTALDWLLKYRKMDWKQIFEFIGASPEAQMNFAQPVERPAPKIISEPDPVWEERAFLFMHQSQKNLWHSAEGEKALKWLTGPERLLTEDVISAWNIGFNPAQKFEPLNVWNIPDQNDGEKHAVFLERGIVIPCYENGRIWYLKIRRAVGKPKYIKVNGSLPGIFGESNLHNAKQIILLEGEFDVMLADHEIMTNYIHGVEVCTFGSASDGLDVVRWSKYFLGKQIFDARDSDDAGEKAVARLKELIPDATRVLFRGQKGEVVKDLTDYKKSGGDVAAWIRFQTFETKELA